MFLNALNLFIVFFLRIAVKIKINKRRLKKKTECPLQIFLIFSFIDVFSSKIASSIRSRNLRLPETWIFSFKFDKCKYCLSILIVQESLYNKNFIMYKISRQFASVLIAFNYFKFYTLNLPCSSNNSVKTSRIKTRVHFCFRFPISNNKVRIFSEGHKMAQRLVTLMKSFFQLENRSCFRIPGLQPSMLECLPDEISLIIFNHLDIQELLCCSHVSTKIRRICNDKSLWKIVDLSGRKGNRRKVKAEFIKAILENECENLILRHTQIDGIINLSKISKLKYLNLDITDRDIEVSKPFFNEILLSCCCLQKLVLGEPGDVLDTALLQRIFSKNGQTLETLGFGFSYFDPIS